MITPHEHFHQKQEELPWKGSTLGDRIECGIIHCHQGEDHSYRKIPVTI